MSRANLASPGAVGGAVAGGGAGGGVDVGDAGVLLVHRQFYIFLYDFPVRLPGHGIDWNLTEIARGDQVVERLRSLLLVESVLRDDRAKRAEIRAQDGFPSLDDGLVVDRNRNRHQDHDDADDDHQLQPRAAATALEPRVAGA